MYARVSTWRAQPQEFVTLDQEIAPTVAEIQRQPGYIAGYELQLAPDTRMIVSLWESEEQMRAAFETGAAAIRGIVESGRLELVETKTCSAEEWH